MDDHLLMEKRDKFPWHASMSQSLELELFSEPDLIGYYSESFSVHSPDEQPTTLAVDVFEFTGGKHFEVLITPSVITSDESLKKLSPSERMCYIEGDQQLSFFKTYTRKNCESNRFSNLILDVCDCIPFNFLRDPDTRVCSNFDNQCTWFFLVFFKDSRSTEDFGFPEYPCPPTCDSVSYDIEVRESKLQGHE